MAQGEILKLFKCSCCINYILSPPKMTMTSAGLAALQSTLPQSPPVITIKGAVLSARLHQTQNCLFNVTHLCFAERNLKGVRRVMKILQTNENINSPSGRI